MSHFCEPRSRRLSRTVGHLLTSVQQPILRPFTYGQKELPSKEEKCVTSASAHCHDNGAGRMSGHRDTSRILTPINPIFTFFTFLDIISSFSFAD